MKRFVIIATLGILTACGTPQEQCIRRETRDLRTLDRLIEETEGNIERGYAIEEYTETYDYWGTCYYRRGIGPDGVVLHPLAYSCLYDRDITMTRPVAIDIDEEKQKLASMQAKRRELERAAEAPIATCKATYPE